MMSHDDIFCFMGRPHTKQVFIILMSKHQNTHTHFPSFLPWGKISEKCQLIFKLNKYVLSENPVLGTTLGATDIIGNNQKIILCGKLCLHRLHSEKEK